MKDPIVKISSGKIQGKKDFDVNGEEYYCFLGIPYAEPPLGKLRFKDPQPIRPWRNIFDATEEGSACAQVDLITKERIGTEDCLNLNVFTKKISDIKSYDLKPVMVFIHGGAYLSGSNSQSLYGANFLIAEDVVLVTINYRLGIFGFFNIDDESLDVPGNQAFKDMLLALKWVQENIRKFCGDSNNVTLFGESAGSGSAHLLMLSPLSKGKKTHPYRLFHKVIAQSGCAINGWNYRRKSATEEIAKKLNMSCRDPKKFLDDIQAVPLETIVDVQLQYEKEEDLGNTDRYIGLLIEKPHPNAFLTKHPWDIIKKGDYHHVPLMMGYNTGEGMLFKALIPKNKRSVYWECPEINVPDLLGFRTGSEVSKAFGKKITDYYMGPGPHTLDNTLEKMFMMTSDNCFVWGINYCVRKHASYSSEPIYFYRMSIETELNTFKILSNINSPGVSHADDLGYLFKSALTPDIEPGSMEDIGRRRFCRMWTNFAKYGDPTPVSDSLVPIKWLPVGDNKLCFLDIGKELQMLENPDKKRMDFWDDIYKSKDLSCKL
ncbi:unnamed protein product [Brassicogethes aeneus]|uniref:Carboxylesterase type B domain-containing protein n=1 Tax=Brassicogethes aeneus TaxID=1431903 RepID=A0A9P0FCD3_BRAAE|nr:unnamed protein product [Brassicogethes aeneus]